jgi:DNA modification methylase
VYFDRFICPKLLFVRPCALNSTSVLPHYAVMNSQTRKLLNIVYKQTADLVENPNNARIHPPLQMRRLEAAIREFGFINPVIVYRSGQIQAGHARVAAAKKIGIEKVPTIAVEELTEDQLRAYALADNRLAEKAGWDKEILAIELQRLIALDNNLDITITGFEIPEIDLIVQEAGAQQDKDDVIEIDPAAPVVTQTGDLWQMNRHRVLCGNSLQDTSYQALLGPRRAQAVFIDPSYNVAIDGNVCGKGSIKHREFSMAVGELSEAEFVAFLNTAFRFLARYSIGGSVHYVCMDWRHMSELLAAGKQIYDTLLNLCVWAKDNGGLGSFYRSRHELIFVFRNGKGQHRNNIQLGQYGRNRTNVWEYPGVNTLSKHTDEGNLLALHPTVKPVQLVADAMLDCSARGDLILDSFLGSGSTLVAAERVGRVCYGMEIDPIYVDVAIRRWQRLTGGSRSSRRNKEILR